MAVGRGVALAPNSIPVAGSLSPGNLSPVNEGLSLEGGVGAGSGSSERKPQASTTGMTRAANAVLKAVPGNLGTRNRRLMDRSSQLRAFLQEGAA